MRGIVHGIMLMTVIYILVLVVVYQCSRGG